MEKEIEVGNNKYQEFNYFSNHGDDEGRNGFTICYGDPDDINCVLISTDDTEEDAQECVRRLNLILQFQAQGLSLESISATIEQNK